MLSLVTLVVGGEVVFIVVVVDVMVVGFDVVVLIVAF